MRFSEVSLFSRNESNSYDLNLSYSQKMIPSNTPLDKEDDFSHIATHVKSGKLVGSTRAMIFDDVMNMAGAVVHPEHRRKGSFNTNLHYER